MSESSYQLSVPIGTSDEKVILALAGVLPQILVDRLHYPAEKARALAPDLARAMVMRARECTLLPRPDKAAIRLERAVPTREQCEQLRKELDAVIRIRYNDPAALRAHQHGIARRAAGWLWALFPCYEDHMGPSHGGVRD